MKKIYKDKDGKKYILTNQTGKYVYLRNETSNKHSIGEKFELTKFKANFTKIEPNDKLYNNLHPESKIVLDFIRKNKGTLIKNVSSSNNKWNASGLSIQNIIGITKENSKTKPDIGNLELKVQKNIRSVNNAPMALFTMAPKCFTKKINKRKSVTKYLASNYGQTDKMYPTNKCLSVNLSHDKYTTKGEYQFKLNVDETEEKVFLVVRDLHTKNILTSDDFGYTFDDIYNRITEKMENLIIVSYDNKKVNNNEYFELMHSWLYLGLNRNKVIELLKNGQIFLNTGVDIKKNFKDKSKNGTLHDHGSEFRLKTNDLVNMYLSTETLY